MSNVNLENELRTAQQAGQTGKFQVIGKVQGASKGITINIFQGNVVKILVGSRSGQEAAKFLATMSIDRIKFMESNGISASPETGTPDTDALLMLVGDKGKASSNDEIIKITARALSRMMGSGSQNLINDIAARFPPSEDPKLFMKKCRESAASVIGAKVADKIFSEIPKIN